jgi:hypothetical protein
MCGGKPKVDTSYQDFAKREARRARREEDARQVRIAEGMTSIAGVFDGMQPVLDDRRAAMEGFYLPQLDKQFGTAKDDLTFALARSGQLTSSTAGKRQGDLSEAFALQRAGIEGDIAGDIANTRNSMNQQRQSLEAALRASGDATAASNAALNTALTFRQDSPTLNPIGNVFLGAGQGIGAIQQGYESGRIKALATPNPIGGGTGRVVRT